MDVKVHMDDLKEADVAAGVIEESELTQPLSKEEDRRIVRKIDLFLLPVMAVTYGLQFLDKQAIPYSSILGLQKDLKLVGQDYSWAGSIFYFGYFAASYPMSYTMVRLPLGKVLAGMVVLWSITLMAMAASHNAAGLQAGRFFLGAFEAAINPGFGLLTVMWFKREEQSMRLGAWFFGNTLFNLVGSLIFYGMGLRFKSFSPWRAGFLIIGGVSLVWGVALMYLLPDTPMNAWFLKPDERKMAVRRIQANKTGIKNDKFKWDQAIDCVKDPISWLLFLVHTTAAIPNGGITNYSTLIVKGLGFSSLQTLLVQMITVVFGAFCVLFGMLTTSYIRNFRVIAVCIYNIVSIVGAVMVIKIDPSHVWARFAGATLMTAFVGNFAVLLGLSTSNIAGFTRKSVLNAMSFIGFCIGNIVGPQMFLSHEAPQYITGFIGMLVFWVLTILEILTLRFYFMYQNKKRDNLQAGDIAAGNTEEDDPLNLLDKTDREMLSFRYVY